MSVLAMKDQLKLVHRENPRKICFRYSAFFDPDGAYLIEGPNIDRPFSMLFISARDSRRFQGTNMCCRPERLRVIRILPLSPREHTIDPPSGRLLGIHQAIGIIPSSQWKEPRYFGTPVGGTVDLTHVVQLVDLMESLRSTPYCICYIACSSTGATSHQVDTNYRVSRTTSTSPSPPVALQGRHMPRHVPVVVFKSPKNSRDREGSRGRHFARIYIMPAVRANRD
ncbi:hypothetical protein CIHG_00492 [Coccidioides immitis H538.4]|uniref:Uncharacterized protein n=3 Tax=Coccidioides immitis TaxID=5501 RepID=A0A0J8QHV2_COCIT|nr:hypothetical protein CIRG_07306 [Coccidioides immitis RMSCC 2394]KMU71924.1 hypothetical protein CISG_00233 [Coccidioides immitis RMSCC 3703]KMU82711.1 hypothetical protein CIHG_00492 [Coccidioides immitis H538.4]